VCGTCGMFAFRHLESRYENSFHRRDRLGIKPLYYQIDAERLCSDRKSSGAGAWRDSSQFNRAALPEYLAFGYLSGEESFYSGIRKLMPGHTMTDRSRW